MEIDDAVRTTAGAVLLTVVAIEVGGAFMVRVVTGRVPTTDFQRRFFRAGHAHAGVLVTLGLVCLLLAQATDLEGVWRWLGQTGVLVAAAVMSMGFFFAAIGPGRTAPSRWVVLLPLGAAVLGAGVVTLGIGLLVA